MYNELALISWATDQGNDGRAGVVARLRDATDALAATTSTLVAPTLPGVHNGGDHIWRATFPDADAAAAARAGDAWRDGIDALLGDPAQVASVEHVAFSTGRRGAGPASGLYRVALFCANQRPTPERVATFTDELASMARYVPTIRSWQLSTPAAVEGTRPWTHVWEQVYDDLDGLKGAYMLHPCHWSHVERWFDPEYPEWLVDPQLCHTYCQADLPLL